MASSKLVVRIFYAIPILEITSLLKKFYKSLRKKKYQDRISHHNESVFESKPNKYHYYTTHNNLNPYCREKLSLRQVTYTYCESRHNILLRINLVRAFAVNTKAKLLIAVSQHQFIPAPGVVVKFTMPRPFEAFVTE